MAKYRKESSRINVQFINSETEEVLALIKDRNHMNVGDIFTLSSVNSIMTHDLKNENLPKKLMVIAVSEYILVED